MRLVLSTRSELILLKLQAEASDWLQGVRQKLHELHVVVHLQVVKYILRSSHVAGPQDVIYKM